MSYWDSDVYDNSWITMNGSWGNMGDYNMTVSYVGANEYGTFSSLRLKVCGTEDGTYKEIATQKGNATTLEKCTFSFDISDYITPASLQKVYFQIDLIESDGTVNTKYFTNSAIREIFGEDERATMIYVKANEPPSTLTFTTSNSSYQDFDKPLKISWNNVAQTGSYAPHHYKIWIRFSFNDGQSWQNDNNYIATGWGIEGNEFEFTLPNLHLDTKNLDRHARFKLRIGIATMDNPAGDIETTRSTVQWYYMSQYVINTSSSNVIMKSGSDFITIKKNNLKQINGTVNTSDMKIKIMGDGSEWARIFWHDVSSTATYFTDEMEAQNCSLSNRYSRLDMINGFNFKYNGQYEFMLCYPKHSTTKYNRWIQIANPLTTTGDASQTAITMGYEPVHIDFTTNWKYGFALSTSTSTYMDCEAGHGNWFGAIGQYKAYSSGGISGFPAPTETGMVLVQKEVELWVRIYRNIEITPIFTKSIIPSKGNEVYINSKLAFLQFCDDINNGNTYEGKIVYLLTDVVTSGASEHVDFTPAGDSTHQFKGIFDGQGHTLSIQYIDGYYDYSGFIGYNAGTIKNLKVLNQYMYASKYAGAICGYNSGLIEQCYSNANIMDDDSDNTLYVGGIAGNNTGIIRKCLSITDISIPTSRAATDCGGIAGQNSGEIISCRNIGSVSGYTSGGIVGWNYVIGSSITRCTNFGTINGVWSGGIAGYTYRGFVDSCLNAGSGASAGIIGMSEYGTSNNCYYASDYNSAGMFFTDTGHTDTTNKATLSSMKSTNMAQKLGNPFFFYDSSWNSWTSSATKQFMKFNWEKTIGWALNENVSNDSFGGNRTGTEVSLTVKILVDWDGTEGIADEFKLLLDGKLCRSVKKPTREMTFVLYPSDGIAANSTYTLTGNWYHYKTGFVTTKTVQADTYMGAACFEEGTMVLTTDGFKPIETIKEGDFVLSKSEESGKIEEQKVYHTYSHNPRNCL